MSKAPSKNTASRFSAKTLKFIETAGRQKRADWLDKNRDEYEATLLLPLQHLARHLQATLGEQAAGYHFPLKSIGRIKRSKNRVGDSGALYKDWISYSVSRPAKSRFEHNPNLYFGMDPGDEDGDQVIVAGGLYMPSSVQMRAIRNAIAEDATAFKKLFSSKAFAERFKGGFSTDKMATRNPRGFDENHPRMNWLKLQAFFVWRSYSLKEFSSEKFPQLVQQDWKQILRLNDLLDQAVHGRLPKAITKTKPAKLISELDEVVALERKMDF